MRKRGTILGSVLWLLCVPCMNAADFRLGIGSPVAANAARVKSAALVVRPENCAEPDKTTITGVAEGIVNGARRSVQLHLTALPAGVHAISQEWPFEGIWVVNLTGSCLGATAGAIVPIGPRGFIRESSKFYPRPATAAEVEAVLKSMASKGDTK